MAAPAVPPPPTPRRTARLEGTARKLKLAQINLMAHLPSSHTIRAAVFGAGAGARRQVLAAAGAAVPDLTHVARPTSVVDGAWRVSVLCDSARGGGTASLSG